MNKIVENNSPNTGVWRFNRRIIYSAFLILSIVAVYWRAFKYPYIQDDWYIIDSICKLGNADYLSNIFSATGNLFYRPVGQLYFLLLYNLSGLDPVGFHIAAILIHCISSLLIVAIANELTGDRLISWTAGFLYAVSVTVHMDSMLWMVGIYDIGGALFFFLAFFLFIKKRVIFSAIVYCLALFTKESTIILLPVLLLYQLHRDNSGKRFLEKFLSGVKAFWRHGIILLVYFLIRIPSLASVPIKSDNPYQIQLTGIHILDNITSFFKWAFEGLNPYFELPLSGISIIIGFSILFFGVYRIVRTGKAKIFFLGGWMALGLLPVIFLTNHFFRYYLTYSLPAFIIFMLYGVRASISIFSLKQYVHAIVFIIMICTSMISSSIYFGILDRQGLNIPTIPGSGNLIRKGAVVHLVQNYLAKEYPSLPGHVSLVFNWVPTVSFGGSIGPRIWYNDSTIHVYEVLRVNKDSSGTHVQLSPDENLQPARVDPKNTILIKYHGDYIRTTNLTDFLQGAPN
jgi:hypothetical protein